MCHGMAFTCVGELPGDLYNYPDLRYLDVDGGGGGVGVVEGRLRENVLLIHLSMSGGNITRFTNVSLPNLNSLDLHDNHILCLCHVNFTGLKSLRILVLRGNPLRSAVVHSPTPSPTTPPLTVLDLTNSRIPQLTLSHFSVFPNLHTLNLSGCSTQHIVGVVSDSLGKLRVLDVRDCPVTSFAPQVFRRLAKLQALFTSTYKLCCSDLLPRGFNLHNCQAPSDSISDCSRLLKDGMHVIFTAIAAALAVTGNVAGCVVRFIRSRARDTVFRALMLHLCVSDGIMGIYLTIISVADRVFHGRYVWQDTAWRGSGACHLSAFLSVLSSQVSTGIVYLVMLDSVVAHSAWLARVRFQPRSVYLSCAAAWLTGVVVSMVITFPKMSLGRGVSDHALCTPLLVSQHTDASTAVSSVVMLNCVLHVLIGAGEVSLFVSSLLWSDPHDPASTANTSTDAVKKLTQAYLGTFKPLCWCIVSLQVISKNSVVTLPEEVPVNIAVFVLPLNAALNPLLSALAVMEARRRQAQRARLMKILTARIAAKSS